MDLKLLFKTDVISFYCHPSHYGVIPEPIAANKCIPDWWKKVPPNVQNKRDDFGDHSMTAKKCLPMLDIMSLGYVIPLQSDLQVITNADCSIIKIHTHPEFKIGSFHDIAQLGGKNISPSKGDAIKFTNYWVIKTAPGWSTMFIPPPNHFNPNFTCFSGLVDTDKYPKEVNFPAIWHTPNFDGKVPAGTPLVNVIPIKRNSFPKKPNVRKMKDSEFNEIERIQKTQHSRSHYYTQELREPRK